VSDRGGADGCGARYLILQKQGDRPASGDASPDHYWLMRRDLTGPQPDTHWPADIRPAAFSPGHTLSTYRLLESGYRDGSGSLPEYTMWLAAFDHNPEFDRSLCFLALADDVPVGVITCWTSAFIKDLVVHPDYRNRGIGGALLRHLFTRLREHGEGFVDLNVMENNLGARRLYEKSDMSYVRRSAVLPS